MNPVSDQPALALPPVETEQPSLAKQLFSRGRLVLFASVFVIELGIYFAAMAWPIGPAEQQALQQQAKSLVNATLGQGPLAAVAGIFENNVRIALLEMIPVAGAALLAFVSFTTGQVIQVEAINASLPGPALGLLLFVFPFAIVELSSYAIAVGSGTMLVLAWRRKSLHKELPVFLFEIALVIVAILVAAAMETMVDVNVVASFVLWAPMALAMAGIVLYGRRFRT